MILTVAKNTKDKPLQAGSNLAVEDQMSQMRHNLGCLLKMRKGFHIGDISHDLSGFLLDLVLVLHLLFLKAL